MTLPAKYQWLNEIDVLPRTISLALEQFGVAEVVGKGSNKTIIAWRDALNQAGVKVSGYTDDDIPWCGLLVAFIALMRMANPHEVVKDPLWALNWKTYGFRVKTPGLGDVLVFKRNGGGHVGFYVGEDDTCYHVLGGNQGNRVSIARVEKSRCVDARRPPYKTAPASAKRFVLTSGGSISRNES